MKIIRLITRILQKRTSTLSHPKEGNTKSVIFESVQSPGGNNPSQTIVVLFSDFIITHAISDLLFFAVFLFRVLACMK